MTLPILTNLSPMIRSDDERIGPLMGGRRQWWDVEKRAMVNALTLYVPFGCPDWRGRNAQNCQFCALPNAVDGYRAAFYDGAAIPEDHFAGLFSAALKSAFAEDPNVHTLMIFNGGSFLAMPPKVRAVIAEQVAVLSGVRRLVVESRAELVTVNSLASLAALLRQAGKELTVRIGVETQDDNLRLRVLHKGHSRKQLANAVEATRSAGVTVGGYVLLNPAPGLDPDWARREAVTTVRWILSGDGLGMDEAYFCSTNVGPDTPLAEAWSRGEFRPASLWMVLAVLRDAVREYPGRVHLLPFKDEPPLLAVPSNHILRGVPQDLSGAQGCDSEFHRMLDRFRQTMDSSLLIPPACACRPEWF